MWITHFETIEVWFWLHLSSCWKKWGTMNQMTIYVIVQNQRWTKLFMVAVYLKLEKTHHLVCLVLTVFKKERCFLKNKQKNELTKSLKPKPMENWINSFKKQFFRPVCDTSQRLWYIIVIPFHTQVVCRTKIPVHHLSLNYFYQGSSSLLLNYFLPLTVWLYLYFYMCVCV